MDPIFISSSQIGDDDLHKLLCGLAVTTPELVITDRFTKVSCKDDRVMSALKAIFPGPGGPIVDAVAPGTKALPAIVAMEEKLSPAFQEVRDLVNHEIDQVVAKVEDTTFPPRKKKKEMKLKPEKQHREIRSWHVIVGDQEIDVIAISEKNRRLNAGEFETGTILSHPRAGRNRVTGEKGQPQGMEPVEGATSHE